MITDEILLKYIKDKHNIALDIQMTYSIFIKTILYKYRLVNDLDWTITYTTTEDYIMYWIVQQRNEKIQTIIN